MGRKFGQDIMNNRSVWSVMNQGLSGGQHDLCHANKRGLSGKQEFYEKKQADPVGRPISRRFAAKIVSTQSHIEEIKKSNAPLSNTNVFGNCIFIDEEYKLTPEQPEPMFLEDTEATSNGLDQMEEVEMEDIFEEPVMDIDGCDANNPLAVVDYVEDLYAYYRKIESSSCISPNYMAHQFDINEKMRAILIDWLIEVHDKFELMNETLYLTVNLIDRFLPTISETLVIRKRSHSSKIFTPVQKVQNSSPPQVTIFFKQVHHRSRLSHESDLSSLYTKLQKTSLFAARSKFSTMTTADADFDLRSAPTPALSVGEYKFADTENLEHCVKYLNQSLITFGFPASLDLLANDPVSTARTCNCIYFLLQQRQRDVEFREAVNEQRQRQLSDISRLEAKVERLETQLQAKDREIATMTRTEAKATAAFKAQIDKLQQERDEFQRMVIGNQQVRTQQIHEMKKKEKEYIKLQERLNQVLMEKKKESKSGMEIMNLLQKEGRQRGTWNGKKADNDFYKKIVDAYEAKNQELVAENTDLRALLRSMQMDMRDFLNAPNGLPKQCVAVGERVETDPSQSPLVGKTDVFDLPFHMARDQIKESLRNKMASIKERMGQLQDAQKGAEVTSEATERELELEAQLVEAKSIIQAQESMMSKHLAMAGRQRDSIVSSPKEAVCN